MTEGTKHEAAALFAEMDLQGAGLLEAWTAYDTNETGTIRCAIKAQEGRRPGGLFLHMIRQGDHLKVVKKQRRTGYRWVRGTHGGTYVRDVKGTDSLPGGHES
jgi:hypothetical protein